MLLLLLLLWVVVVVVCCLLLLLLLLVLLLLLLLLFVVWRVQRLLPICLLQVRTSTMRSGDLLHWGRAKAVPRGHFWLDRRLDVVRMQRALSDWELLPCRSGGARPVSRWIFWRCSAPYWGRVEGAGLRSYRAFINRRTG